MSQFNSQKALEKRCVLQLKTLITKYDNKFNTMGKDKHMSDEENQVDETGDNESYDFSALGAPKEATKKKQKRVDKEFVFVI